MIIFCVEYLFFLSKLTIIIKLFKMLCCDLVFGLNIFIYHMYVNNITQWYKTCLLMIRQRYIYKFNQHHFIE